MEAKGRAGGWEVEPQVGRRRRIWAFHQRRPGAARDGVKVVMTLIAVCMKHDGGPHETTPKAEVA